MSDAFNQLSAAQAERLALLAEECGEVVQAVGKILRHGYESSNPYDSSMQTNRNYLEVELGDLNAAVAILACFGDLSEEAVFRAKHRKLLRVGRYLHHQEPRHD